MKTAFFEKNAVTPIVKIDYHLPSGQVCSFWLKRDDQIDAKVSGNKWRKLKFNIKHAIALNYQGIASFGGAFSNHISALSRAANLCDLKSIGFIRTDNLDPQNPTLRYAKEQGMHLIPLSRTEYRHRHDPDFINELKAKYPEFLFVPEGGSNQLAQEGLKELAEEIINQDQFDYVACAIGSGGTTSGLCKHLPCKVLGVPVVKDNRLLNSLQSDFPAKLHIHKDAMFGGYGKLSDELETFCLDFYQQTGVVIEPIYTGKLMYALCKQRHLLGVADDAKILALHTGGLQGLKGLVYRHQIDQSAWQHAMSSLAL